MSFFKANFIHNYEEAEYGPFIGAHSVEDGLAVYSVGSGEPLLLFPYPHSHNTTPMAEGALAQLLAGMGKRIITFDVPGAYRSQRQPAGDMAEMIHCAGETLARLHKKLRNLMSKASYHDKSLFAPLMIEAADRQKGVPIRTIWSKNMYRRLSYADRLGQVRAPTLILAGRHDPQSPLPNAQELSRGIPNSKLIIFEESGHSPFIEEAELFKQQVKSFLDINQVSW